MSKVVPNLWANYNRIKEPLPSDYTLLAPTIRGNQGSMSVKKLCKCP